MFSNKKNYHQEKEFGREKFTKEKTDLECIKEVTDENVSPIHPIIFTNIGLSCNNSLIDYPLNLMSDINLFIVQNEDKMLKTLDQTLLRRLDNNSRNLTKIEVVNFIKQTAIMNFCSIFNSSEYRKYFDMIPVLEMVKEEIDNDYAIERILETVFWDEVFGSYLTSREDLLRTRAFVDNISYQLGQAVCSSICLGADKAINDVVLQIHVVPNIKNLYKQLLDDNKFLAKLNQESPQDYPTFVAIHLKEIVMDMVNDIINSVIGPSITLIMRSLVYTAFFSYSDYLYYDKEAAGKQIKELDDLK